MSQEFATVHFMQIAEFVSKKLNEIAVPSSKFRPDFGHIQADPIIIIENYEEIPAIKLSFELDGGFGTDIKVRVKDFVENPQGYMRDLFQNINGIKYAAEQRRAERHDEVGRVLRAMASRKN